MKKLIACLTVLLMAGASFAASGAQLLKKKGCGLTTGDMLECGNWDQECKISTSVNQKNGLDVTTVKVRYDKQKIDVVLEFVDGTSAKLGRETLILARAKMSCNGDDCSAYKMLISTQLGGYPFRYDVFYGIPVDEAKALAEGGDDALGAWVLLKAMQGDQDAANQILIAPFIGGMLNGLCVEN
jgi:hypothetical protein